MKLATLKKAKTPFLKPGDAVEISMSQGGQNVFDSIRQKVVQAP